MDGLRRTICRYTGQSASASGVVTSSLRPLLAVPVALSGVMAVSASERKADHYPLTARDSSLSASPGLLPILSARERDGSRPPDPHGTKDPRLSSHVARLAQAQRQTRSSDQVITALNLSPLDPDLQAMAKAQLMRIDGRGRLQAYVVVAKTVNEAATAIEQAQGQVERIDETAEIIQALVPIGQLEARARQPSVKFIRLPDYGFPDGSDNCPAVPNGPNNAVDLGSPGTDNTYGAGRADAEAALPTASLGKLEELDGNCIIITRRSTENRWEGVPR